MDSIHNPFIDPIHNSYIDSIHNTYIASTQSHTFKIDFKTVH